MAINPETQYPGKINPSTADYPYGSARNVTISGDGTGTPWEAAIVNDLLGFQQSLLSAASVVPSGTPDKVGTSQYLEALLKVSGRQVMLTTDILTTNLSNSNNLVTLGRSTVNDGGNAIWTFTGNNIPTNAGTEDIANRNIYDSVGNEFKYNEIVINPAAFGILPSSGDNSPAWQSLLNSNPVHIHFSVPGNYIFLSNSTHNASITITGNKDVIINCIDGSYTGAYWTKFTGAFPQIENLSINAIKGERTLTFTSAPSLSPGDVFVIFNPTNSSWSDFRAEYFAGEFCHVVSISGSTVVVAGELYDNYNTGDVNVYRLDAINVNISNLTVKGDMSNSIIDMEFCRDSLIYNVKITHKNNSCISIIRSYNCAVVEPSIFNEGDGGDDYGIVVSNSQTIRVNDGNVHSRRHSITTGGDGEIGAVPCRDLRFSNLTLSNDINSGTHCADFHGNTEDSQYINCEIYGGATWQGKNNGYVNCRIGNLLAGPCILGSEIAGGKLYTYGCTFHGTIDPFTTSRALIDVGGNSSAVDARTVDDCTFEILNCTINSENFSASTSIANMRNRGTNAKLNYIIDGLRLNVNDLGQVLFTSDDGVGTPDSDFIIVDHIVSPTTAISKLLCNHNSDSYTNFPHRLQKQSGKEQLTSNTGASFVTGTPVVFKWSYPRNPSITMSRTNRGYIGNRIGIAYADPADMYGLTPAIATDDATNFSAATTVDVNWIAGIEEI